MCLHRCLNVICQSGVHLIIKTKNTPTPPFTWAKGDCVAPLKGLTARDWILPFQKTPNPNKAKMNVRALLVTFIPAAAAVCHLGVRPVIMQSDMVQYIYGSPSCKGALCCAVKLILRFFVFHRIFKLPCSEPVSALVNQVKAWSTNKCRDGQEKCMYEVTTLLHLIWVNCNVFSDYLLWQLGMVIKIHFWLTF